MRINGHLCKPEVEIFVSTDGLRHILEIAWVPHDRVVREQKGVLDALRIEMHFTDTMDLVSGLNDAYKRWNGNTRDLAAAHDSRSDGEDCEEGETSFSPAPNPDGAAGEETE